MGVISIRVSDDDDSLIREYVRLNNLNLSKFVRETILDKIENEMKMSEEFTRKLHKSRNDSKKGELYSLENVRKELDIC